MQILEDYLRLILVFRNLFRVNFANFLPVLLFQAPF